MYKLLKSNLREVIALVILIPLMLFALALLGTAEVAESGPLSTLVSLGVTLLSGVLKFAVVLALAWFGLAITLPEANKFVVSCAFDDWWSHLNFYTKGYVAIAFTAVLILAAAICMAA